MNIIQASATTADKSDKEVEELYWALKNLIHTTKKPKIIIILKDFNAQMGKGD